MNIDRAYRQRPLKGDDLSRRMSGADALEILEYRLCDPVDDIVRSIGGRHKEVVQGSCRNFARLAGIAVGWDGNRKKHLCFGFDEIPLDRDEADTSALARFFDGSYTQASLDDDGVQFALQEQFDARTVVKVFHLKKVCVA